MYWMSRSSIFRVFSLNTIIDRAVLFIEPTYTSGRSRTCSTCVFFSYLHATRERLECEIRYGTSAINFESNSSLKTLNQAQKVLEEAQCAPSTPSDTSACRRSLCWFR
jgi:hypothetical protein